MLLAAAAWTCAEAVTTAGPADTVVVLSIDGMRWDYPARAGAPTLARLAREGASCRALLPPFPSSTFPAHASLATGVFPDRHGIVNNEFIDRRRGFYRRDDDATWLLAEPIWVTAIGQGRRAFDMFWPGSEAAIEGVRPNRWWPFDGSVPNAERVSRVLDWLALPESERPSIVTLSASARRREPWQSGQRAERW